MSQFHFLNKTQPPRVEALNLGPNTAAVLVKTRKISVESTPMPILQPDGLIVKVIATDKSCSHSALEPRAYLTHLR